MEKALNEYSSRDDTPIMKRRRKKSKSRLSLDEKLAIIKSVIVEKKDYLFISKQFGVSISYVS